MPIAEQQIQITPEWFTLRDVPADGNCLFHAISAQNDVPVAALRKIVWEELQDPRYRDALPEPPRDVNFTWSGPFGDIAPYALSRALGTTIFIVSRGVGYFIHPEAGRTASPLYLFLHAGHYCVLIPGEPLLLWEDAFYDRGCDFDDALHDPAGVRR